MASTEAGSDILPHWFWRHLLLGLVGDRRTPEEETEYRMYGLYQEAISRASTAAIVDRMLRGGPR